MFGASKIIVMSNYLMSSLEMLYWYFKKVFFQIAHHSLTIRQRKRSYVFVTP